MEGAWFAFHLKRSTKRRGCLLSYSQAELRRELWQPRKYLLAEPCTLSVSQAALLASDTENSKDERLSSTFDDGDPSGNRSPSPSKVRKNAGWSQNFHKWSETFCIFERCCYCSFGLLARQLRTIHDRFFVSAGMICWKISILTLTSSNFLQRGAKIFCSVWNSRLISAKQNDQPMHS